MCLGFGECGIVEKTPPECPEDRFCELRIDGVLGSSRLRALPGSGRRRGHRRARRCGPRASGRRVARAACPSRWRPGPRPCGGHLYPFRGLLRACRLPRAAMKRGGIPAHASCIPETVRINSRLPLVPTHASAWKARSANFECKGFSEVASPSKPCYIGRERSGGERGERRCKRR
jgi:hypothetical protein